MDEYEASIFLVLPKVLQELVQVLLAKGECPWITGQLVLVDGANCP